VNQAIVKLFDGVRVLEPWVVYLKPMHENPEMSWFDTTGRVGEQAETERPRRRAGSWPARSLSMIRQQLWRPVAAALRRRGRPVRADHPTELSDPVTDERQEASRDGHHAGQP
jgi:hypothetical protein